jgi:antimicrobial peptide system SdpA family protein
MQSNRWIPVVRRAAMGTALAISAFMFIASNPDSPLLPTRKVRRNVVSVAPEGWAFFTRNPREPKTYTWSVDSNGTLGSENPVDVRGFALAGLSRRSRIRGIEVGQIMQSIPEDRWVQCRGPVEECGLSEAKWVPVRNTMAAGTLCGRVVFESKPPVPWAWSGGERPVHMPAKVAFVDIDCTQEEVT